MDRAGSLDGTRAHGDPSGVIGIDLPNRPAWDDAPWNPLGALHGDTETDVCVVGLGGSGLTCIRELRALGVRVIGVDAGSVGGGAAGRNGGFLLAGTAAFYHDAVAQLGRDRARAIYRATLDEMDRITSATPDLVRRVGSLRIAASPAAWDDCRSQREAMRADGFDVEEYDGTEGRGLLFPADGTFQPLARCRSLAQQAIREGAVLFEHTPALSMTEGVVTTARGRIECRHVIVAVDGRLDVLLPELAGRVRTARLQMLGTAPLGEVRFERPVYSRWGYDYWQQLPNGSIVLGGCRDHEADAEWTTDAEPSVSMQERLDAVLRDRLGVSAPVTHRWAASVAYTDAGLPLLEEVRPGVWAIGAYNGTGNVLGALYGRMVAQIVVRGASNLAGPFVGGERRG